MADMDPDNPIFDQLEGLAPPHQQNLFFGHKKVEEVFLSAWQSGKMHHAWLLTGPKGIGKATFAYRAARFIFTEGSRPSAGASLLGDVGPADLSVGHDSHASHLVSNLSHPNLLTIDRPFDQKTKKFRTEITVDEVRKTVRFFGSTAGEDTWRVCIVDPADDLNGNAANALLKILEEPPERVIFFLIAHAPGRLLPTIRSRCRRLSFSPLENPDLSNALLALDIAPEEQLADLSAMSDGSIRKAAELQTDEGMVLVHAFERLLQPPFNPDYESLSTFAEIVDQRGKEQRFDGFADLVHRYLSNQLHQSASGGQATGRGLYPLAEAWEKASEMIRETRVFNLDKKQTTIAVMRMIAKASKGQ